MWTWTAEELEDMIHLLKERGTLLRRSLFSLFENPEPFPGMVEWMKEYILNRKEPVQKLLSAFNIELVRAVSSY